jgi:hypothetical protein
VCEFVDFGVVGWNEYDDKLEKEVVEPVKDGTGLNAPSRSCELVASISLEAHVKLIGQLLF